ncbi:MAG: LysM peptidoglycan-binding domain-containing protein, partial [Anaerolineae bacterium]|nr:LysM peptidoglycan-binding domain-containing protein [Anaerolineae bacterium]
VILLPTHIDACYTRYAKNESETRFDTERRINRCYQEFVEHNNLLYVRNDAPPCYNESGQRLGYPPNIYLDQLNGTYNREGLAYQDMAIHIFQRDDNLYSISQTYNVCVEDLLAANPNLVDSMPTGYPTFIPNTRPCYDEASGQQLIYEDENGYALEDPQISDQLMYYGNQPLGHISHYYNVCQNRIEDANSEKMNHRSTYLGWVIPTDRPDCFDEDGDLINYVCYDNPVDMTVDYRGADDFPTVNPDGVDCYDLADPYTRIWYEGEAYQIMDYEKEKILASRAFTAWCYGVSLDAIDAINDQQVILDLLPYHHRLIPEATRECYIDHPELLNYFTVHQVERYETLLGIAHQYNVLPQWITQANNLGGDNMIWERQMLIIPDGMRLSHIFAIFMSVMALFITALLFYRLRRRPTPKKKRQNN